MKRPLSFQQSFWLFIRNTRRLEPADADFGSRLVISQLAAIAISWSGLFAGVLAMLGSGFLLTRPLIDFFLPSFFVALLVVHLLTRGLVSYALYRFWHWRTHDVR